MFSATTITPADALLQVLRFLDDGGMDLRSVACTCRAAAAFVTDHWSHFRLGVRADFVCALARAADGHAQTRHNWLEALIQRRHPEGLTLPQWSFSPPPTPLQLTTLSYPGGVGVDDPLLQEFCIPVVTSTGLFRRNIVRKICVSADTLADLEQTGVMLYQGQLPILKLGSLAVRLLACTDATTGRTTVDLMRLLHYYHQPYMNMDICVRCHRSATVSAEFCASDPTDDPDALVQWPYNVLTQLVDCELMHATAVNGIIYVDLQSADPLLCPDRLYCDFSGGGDVVSLALLVTPASPSPTTQVSIPAWACRRDRSRFGNEQWTHFDIPIKRALDRKYGHPEGWPTSFPATRVTMAVEFKNAPPTTTAVHVRVCAQQTNVYTTVSGLGGSMWC